jgi:amino acid transporter
MSGLTPQAIGSSSSEAATIRRVLTRWDLILFGLVILCPTAVYPVYGIIQHESHGQAALSYVVAMVAMLFTAASYGRMASVYPSAGSTYTYVQQSFNPVVGFIAGWAMILDYFLIPLESVIYSALTAQRFVPAIPYFVWVLLFTAGITVINVRGIRILARANTVMMAAMTVCAILFIVLAADYVLRHYGAASLISSVGILPRGQFSLRLMMLGASIAALSYIGFDAISTLAEDTLHPEKDIAFSTVLVCVLQTLICVVTVYFAALAWNNYGSFPHTDTAILDIGRRIGGQVMFLTLTFVLMVAGVSSALTGQAGASRLLFAMGRDRVISHSLFGHIHPRHGTPTRAIYVTSAASLAGALLMNFQIAVELLNFGAFVGFILVNLSVIQHFYISQKQRSTRTIFSNLLFPLAGTIICIYVWMSLSTKAKLTGFAWLAIGVIYVSIITRGFKTKLSQWSGDTFK